MSKPTNIRFEGLGRFEVKSGSLTISDPAYHPGTWCAGKIKARNGWWDAGLLRGDCGSWGERALVLVAAAPHVDAFRLTELAAMGVLVDSGIDVGVDSGSCGIYDTGSYMVANEKALEDLPPHARAALDSYIEHGNRHFGGHQHDAWHDLNAAFSLSKADGGAFDGGCVSSSGYGDGSYRCLIRKDGDEAIGVVVVFIDPKADDGEES